MARAYCSAFMTLGVFCQGFGMGSTVYSVPCGQSLVKACASNRALRAGCGTFPTFELCSRCSESASGVSGNES